MKTGIVFDLKEFAVYDGPGIRQTVFLKGCPLRCNWCHNPEGFSAQPQLMVSEGSCTHCGRCKEACRNESCIACGECVKVCPLRLRKVAGDIMTSAELEALLRVNSDYYAEYGGGVTFSGGEPLMQADFLIEVLDRLSDMHRAIQTSGYTDPRTFCQVVERLDYVMLDIKLFDNNLHKKYTGVDNRDILANAKYLCTGDTPFVVRIPLIPGVNDNEENFRATARWISGARALEKVELLPYHKTAGAKYSMVGSKYAPLFDTDRPVLALQEIFSEYNIRSFVL